MKHSFSRIIILLFCFTLRCEASESAEPPKIGNFALPGSQQPGPLVGFGQNILDKHETQLTLSASDYAGIDKHFIDLTPSVVYGITDKLSVSVNVPYAASFKTGPDHSTGFEDASTQVEYAVYNKSTSRFEDQATLLGGISVPTGSTQKMPQTGLGSPSFFLGTTFDRTYVKWFVFAAPGAELTTNDDGTQFGNNYLYQMGFGKNITNVNGWILAWMTEVDGTYTQKDVINGITDPDSGGNVIYATPSFWASTKQFIFQFGVGLPISQNLNGDQTRETYLIDANLSWSIY